MKDLPVYYGNSMRSVFAPGERLLLKTVDFAALQPGDIVMVEAQRVNYVHRVIRKTAEFAVTMGDNNEQADDNLVWPTSKFSLVSGCVKSDGTVRNVACGRQGMSEFYHHQRRMAIRRWGRNVFEKMEWLFFWRIKADRIREFGSEKCYFYRNVPVARRTAAGKIVYTSWRMRLLFKVPSGEEKHAE